MVKSPEILAFVNALSRLLGWTYFLAWSISFYAQPYLNWQRKSTQGLAIDFPTLNLLGFVCYTISTASFLWSPTIRSQYAARHPASPKTTVRFNDFAFALHAAIMCIVTYSQFYSSLWGFSVGRRQRASRGVLGIVLASILSTIVIVFVIAGTPGGGNDPDGWAWIDLIYTLGYIKLVCSLIKYCPQVFLNYKRKSTVGWSILNILLDFTGGILSLMQLIIDSSLQGDWSGIIGNPVKLGLSNTSLFFDVIFMVQHYV
ncbi:L-cystine transporter-like protein [Microthyrium microscopicum]|uniref:L-cystine transporter-like protein n=1 Tax=Microthyrium microscopicum TaxID=703497 RepID=A0A6A6U1X7_9PEZI|nr:L-cystine transporter-like protein [Microthyrium microscopicum]